MGFDIQKIRKDFPVLLQKVYNRPLVYLDNGATTQKPQVVIDTISSFFAQKNSSIHRGIHYLSEQATEAYENARKIVQRFINAEYALEIVFTSGATGSINTLASSFGEKYVKKNDEIVVTEMEHHSNIVPWQLLCERKGAKLKVVPFDDNGMLDIAKYRKLLNNKTKIVAVTHVSNSLGTINPVKEIINIAHSYDIPVLVDGAQAIQHLKVDVQELDCDFYVFSGHKVFGPTGVGVLYGKEDWMYNLPPYQGGGDMVDCVRFEGTTYADLPFKFEAGTMNFVGAIGLAVALEYVLHLGLENIEKHEKDLLDYGLSCLSEIEGIKFYGTAEQKIAIFSFLLDNIHPYDAGMILDKMGIAIRTGTHCTQPVMDKFNIEGTMRASLALYNTREEIDILCQGLRKVKQMLG